MRVLKSIFLEAVKPSHHESELVQAFSDFVMSREDMISTGAKQAADEAKRLTYDNDALLSSYRSFMRKNKDKVIGSLYDHVDASIKSGDIPERSADDMRLWLNSLDIAWDTMVEVETNIRSNILEFFHVIDSGARRWQDKPFPGGLRKWTRFFTQLFKHFSKEVGSLSRAQEEKSGKENEVRRKLADFSGEFVVKIPDADSKNGVFTSGTMKARGIHDVKREVNLTKGFSSKVAVWAETLLGEFIFGLDANGKELKSAP